MWSYWVKVCWAWVRRVGRVGLGIDDGFSMGRRGAGLRSILGRLGLVKSEEMVEKQSSSRVVRADLALQLFIFVIIPF